MDAQPIQQFFGSQNTQPQDVLARWQFDLGVDVENLGHYFAGDSLDINGDWINNADQAIMNAKGVRSLMRILEFGTNKMVTMGNFSEEEQAEVTSQFCQSVDEDIFMNGKKYQLKKENYEMVRSLLINAQKASITGGKKGFRAAMVNTTITNASQELVQKNPQEAQPNIIQKVTGWGHK